MLHRDGQRPAVRSGRAHGAQVQVQHHAALDQRSIRRRAPDEQSLDQWMVVNPLHFSIPARGSQTVRFSIRPRVPPRPGEHRAMIYFNQVLPPAEHKAVRVKFSFGVAVYAAVGDVSRIGEIHDVSIVPGTNPVVVRLDVSSAGTAHVRLSGRYAIYAADAYSGAQDSVSRGPAEGQGASAAVASGLLPSRPVLPSTRRQLRIQTEHELPTGAFVLDLSGDLSGQPVHVALPFRIDDPALVAGSPAEPVP